MLMHATFANISTVSVNYELSSDLKSVESYSGWVQPDLIMSLSSTTNDNVLHYDHHCHHLAALHE